ncbi:MAG: radical SAM protein [Armatimonadota bacterium]
MSVLKIHLTYHCSAQCDHCHLVAGTAPSRLISPKMAMGVIEELQRINDLQYVVMLGGEPGLYQKLTIQMAEFVHGLGIGVRVETNTSWATDDTAARAFLEPLCRVGTHIMLSIDACHEPFVPLERVIRAIRVLDELQGEYTVQVSLLDYPAARQPLDQRTMIMYAEAERQAGHSLSDQLFLGPVFFKGRGAHALAPLVSDGRGVPDAVCDVVPWWGNGEQNTLELLSLDPEGNIGKECGISFGNVYEQSVEQILHKYNAETHPVISTLVNEGPLGLAKEAVELGYVMKADYADRCHLCQEAREWLVDKYPQYLTPNHHYQLRNNPNESVRGGN